MSQPHSMKNLQETIASYIAEGILKDKHRTIRLSEPLISSGLVDSFSLVDLALFVEAQFGVRIQDHELNAECIDTLHQLLQLVRNRL